MKYLTVNQIQNLVNLMADKPVNMELSFIDEVKQYRLLCLHLPRRSGKTTAIREFIRGKSVLFHDGITQNFINFRGYSCIGLRYQYIVVDEQQRFDYQTFFKMLIDLKHSDMLTDDFKVILIGTPK